MILYQIWCKRTYVSGGFCEGEDEPTQLIFTTLDKARSKYQKTIIVKKMVHVNTTLKRLKLNKNGGIVMVISRKKQLNYVLNLDYPIIGNKVQIDLDDTDSITFSRFVSKRQ